MSGSDQTPLLVIEDDLPIRCLLRTSLSAQGFQVHEAKTGAEGVQMLSATKPELIILDLGLPDIDGLSLIGQLREQDQHVPIIILSSRGDEVMKVEALNSGADDYVTKPFGMSELVARIHTALRHKMQMQGAEPIFKSGTLKVDLVHRVVTVNDEAVKLSPKEYDILRLLVMHAGKVLTHRFIMQEVWGAGGDIQYLRIYIRQLRAKIEKEPERPDHIITETGVGYRLNYQPPQQ